MGLQNVCFFPPSIYHSMWGLLQVETGNILKLLNFVITYKWVIFFGALFRKKINKKLTVSVIGAKYIYFRFEIEKFLIIGIAGMSAQQEDEILPPRSPTAILSDVQLRIVTGGKPAANGIAIRHNPMRNGQNWIFLF
jgi:hypothetical protein